MGVVFDVVIVIIVWRILVWVRIIKLRLRMLVGILFVFGLGVGIFWGLSGDGVGSDILFWFDVVIDGLMFVILLVFSSFFVFEGGVVLGFVGVVIFIIGFFILV